MRAQIIFPPTGDFLLCEMLPGGDGHFTSIKTPGGDFFPVNIRRGRLFRGRSYNEHQLSSRRGTYASLTVFNPHKGDELQGNRP